jgi:BirA family transcriptional regulator, biotin operon repressor / biotin---[acetyl-CoA-carboxylase] ligase
MQTLFMGQNHIALKEVDSTNDYTKTLLETETPLEGTVITAQYQEGGRGQLGKWWLSEKGANITASYVLYPSFLGLDQIFCLNMAVSLAVRACCEAYTAQPIQIKWPNDVYHAGNKVAGILIENSIKGQAIQSSIIGIGLNVNELDFYPLLKNPTSLRAITGQTYLLEAVLETLSIQLEKYYLMLRQGSYEQLEQLYLGALYRYQEAGLYARNGHLLNGTITGVARDGKLIMISNGKEHQFAPQEVSFILP